MEALRWPGKYILVLKGSLIIHLRYMFFMFSRREDSASAIFFFSDTGIAKELLYTEFEALLEGFTPETEWAGRDAKAAYLELSPDLSLKSAVFFLVAFDSEGWVEASWNMPLVNLARMAKPLAGDDSPRVMTAANVDCQDYIDLLWTPDLSLDSEVLDSIRNALAVNRLGLSKKVTDEVPAAENSVVDAAVSHEPLSGAMESQLAHLLQSQMAGAKGVAHTLAELEQVKEEYEAKLAALSNDLAEKVQQYQSAKAQVELLEAQLDSKDRRLSELKKYYELKLEKTKGEESDYIKALRIHYEKESSEQITNAKLEYKELLNWREVELMYRAERESQLHEEIAKLRLQNSELGQADADNLLQTLSEKGISFMAYQVGLGHISIPVDDIPLYLANPVGFVAAYCNVTQAVYLDWLAHYHAPVCRVTIDSGEPCGMDVERIDTPELFMVGVSDCCAKHRNMA